MHSHGDKASIKNELLEERAEKSKQECLKSQWCRDQFNEKFESYEIEYETVVQECFDYHWWSKKYVI